MKLTVSLVTLLAFAAGAYAQQTSNSLLPQPALQELSPAPLPGQAPPNDNPMQEIASDPSDMAHMTAEDYLAMELPPLGVLIDNSRQTAQMQYYNTAIDEAKTDLKTERRNWLKYFRATGNYQYGQMNWLSTLSGSDAADPLPVVPTYQGKEQSYWNVGGVVSIPLNDLFDRRNRVKIKTGRRSGRAERGALAGRVESEDYRRLYHRTAKPVDDQDAGRSGHAGHRTV